MDFVNYKANIYHLSTPTRKRSLFLLPYKNPGKESDWPGWCRVTISGPITVVRGMEYHAWPNVWCMGVYIHHSCCIYVYILVICCCITVLPQTQKYKTTPIYYLTISLGQEFWHGLAGSSENLLSRCRPGLGLHLEAQLGKDPPLSSCSCWLNSVPCTGWGGSFSCWLSPAPQFWEATHGHLLYQSQQGSGWLQKDECYNHTWCNHIISSYTCNHINPIPFAVSCWLEVSQGSCLILRRWDYAWLWIQEVRIIGANVRVYHTVWWALYYIYTISVLYIE